MFSRGPSEEVTKIHNSSLKFRQLRRVVSSSQTNGAPLLLFIFGENPVMRALISQEADFSR